MNTWYDNVFERVFPYLAVLYASIGHPSMHTLGVLMLAMAVLIQQRLIRTKTD